MKPIVNNMKTKWKAVGILALATLINKSAYAQAASSTQASEEAFLFYVVAGMLIFVTLAVLAVAYYTLQVLKLIMFPETVQAVEITQTESIWTRLRKRFITGDMVPVEQEQVLVIDHTYDGIQELNNFMPPWLKYLFYGTIAFAAIYLVNFFSLGLVETSEQEYVAEMAQAEKSVAEHRKLVAASIDEKSAKLVTDAAMLEGAKAIFDQNCKACHGGAGEGGVGPNLTDEYWLHGGNVQAVFKSIKYGIPQKGMIAWQQKLKPDEIQNVASYILSLQGTKPSNGKQPEGEKVVNSETKKNKTISMN